MRVWVYVEGQSDAGALAKLWEEWRTKLRGAGWGIQIIPLAGKSRYFTKLGSHAAAKLVNNPLDLVVGLPDLYPNSNFSTTEYRHDNLQELKAVQVKLVKDALVNSHRITATEPYLSRFYATALKHDLEMILLAAHRALAQHLKTNSTLGNWQHPVENQNQDKPPKRIVEELYRSNLKRSYRDTTDAVAVMRKVSTLNELIFSPSGQIECPVFKTMLDWIGTRVGIPAYSMNPSSVSG